MLFKKLPLVCLVALSAALCLPAAAAPETGDSDLTLRESGPAAKGPIVPQESPGTPDPQGNSRTIRMLLELQNAPPPLEGTGDPGYPGKQRAQPPRGSVAGSPTTGDAEGASLTGGPKGDTPPTVDWRSGLPGRTVNAARAGDGGVTVASGREGRAGAPRYAQSAPEDEIDIKGLLPRKLLNFLRENREWVLLGGLVVLALVWIGAAGASQRRS